MRSHLAAVLALLSGLGAGFLTAQIDTGVLSGHVYDDTGAAIPGARISVVNTGTNYRLPLETNAAGLYVSPPLPAGTYRIEVANEGFQKAIKQVQLSLAERLAIDFTLELGVVTEQVTVQEQSVVLQTEQATLSTLRTATELRQLPLNDRNFAELMRYTPGVVPGQAMKSNLALSQQRGNTSNAVNGTTFADNNFVVDGIQNNSTHQGWGLMLFPEVEALEQYRIETSVPDARYGRSGATLNVGYKSGTNRFHGTLFHFLRNDKLDARNFFATGEKPPLKRNFFGGVLSGPIGGRDASTFFLVSYEGRRTRQTKTFVSDVPTPRMRGGDFGELLSGSRAIRIFDPLTTQRDAQGRLTRQPFPNNVIPAARLNPAAVNVMNHYPLPNQAGLASNFLVNPSDVRDADQYTVKIDRAFEGGSRGFIRYTQGDFDNIESRELGPVASPSLLVDLPVWQIVPSYTHVISPRTINQTRLGFSYQPLDNLELTGGENTAQRFGIPNVNVDDFTTGLSRVVIPGYTPIGAKGCTPAILHFSNYQLSNNTDMTRGNHSLSMGVDVVRRHSNVRQSCDSRGNFSFSTIYTNNPVSPQGTGFGGADLLLGTPQSIVITRTFGTLGLRRSDIGLYFQDNWKVTPRFTLNLGMRYEVPQDYPHSEVGDRLVQFDLASALPVPFAGSRFAGGSGVGSDSNNFAPRVGFAFRVTNRTVIRSAYGIYYSLVPIPVVTSLASQSPTFVNTTVVNNQANFAGSRAISDGPLVIDDLNRPGQNRVGLAGDFRVPYMQQWNFALQRELPGTQTATIAYVGTKGTSINQRVNYNQPDPGDGAINPRRRWPQHSNVRIFQSAANSTYHSLQATVNKRFSHGFNYLFAYTWSHYLDDASVGGGGAADISQIPIDNLRLNKGNSDQDVRHQVRASMQYELPFGRGKPLLSGAGPLAQGVLGGWQMNSAISLYSGFPFTVIANSNTLNIGEASRADRLAEGTLSAGQRSIRRWFDADAFGNPGFRRWGNGGRNILFGPGTKQVDFSVFKTFRVGEGKSLQFRTEFFNVSNTPQFNNPNSRIGSPNTGRINSAGSETTLQRTQRQIQFALKFLF